MGTDGGKVIFSQTLNPSPARSILAGRDSGIEFTAELITLGGHKIIVHRFQELFMLRFLLGQ